jgi:CPA2 family monovalent cation:H+ antiporter-2
MTVGESFIQDFAVVLVFAFGITLLFSRIKQPVVLGYLVAGSLIGPYFLKLVSDLDTIDIFAELGIILLMFSVGLEFNLKKLRRVGTVAVGVGVLEILLVLGLGNAVGRMIGWTYTESIFLGGILAFSSTAVIVKILTDMKALRKKHTALILGILIIEDVGAVILLTMLGSVSMIGASRLLDVVVLFIKIIIFFTVTLVFGLRFVPPLINRVKETNTSEVLLLTSLGLCFALAAFSGYMGFSVALGALMMGAIISESKHRTEVVRITEPVKDVFASIFFISIGMLVDFSKLMDLAPIILLLSAVAILGKVASVSLGTYLAGFTGTTALSTGLGMMPRGEFSFIIAKLGVDQGAVSPDFYLVTVALALITTIVTPVSLKKAPDLSEFIKNKTPIQVRSFFKYLYTWIHETRTQFKLDSEMASEFKKRTLEIAINGLIIIIIFLAMAVIKNYAPIAIPLPSWFKLNMLAMVTGTILSLPSLYLIVRNIRNLIDISITIFSFRFRFLDVEIIKKTLGNAVYLALIFIFSITLLPLIMAELVGQGIILGSSLLALIALSGYFFWKTINKFHDLLDTIIKETILAEDVDTDEGEELIVETIKEDRDTDLEKLIVGRDSSVVGKSIIDIKLRNVTGATIISIERRKKVFRNPKPTQVLKGGDIIWVIGTDTERSKAKELIE